MTASFEADRRRRRHGRTATAIGVLLVVLANAAVIVWLWLHGGGISAVHSRGDLLTSLGRITGFLGAYLALLEVLLLARLPWFERLTGFDKLTVWHRWNGKTCLILLLAHTVLITIGYALLDRLSLGREISELTHYPGVVTATIGTGLLVLVVATSLVAARKRLPYELWYAIHLSSYAGIALAWSHQIPTGNDLVKDELAADYWRVLYVVTLALLLAFRVVQPLARAFRYRLRVAAVTPESASAVSVRIAGRGLDRLNARPGQFFIWRFLNPRWWWSPHPFSLSEAPKSDSFRITMKNVGDFTSRAAGIRPGTRVIAEGPFGSFTDDVRRRERVALIAGGIGITPIRALAETMHGDIALIYRVLKDDDVVFGEELDRLAEERKIALSYVVGDHASPGGARLMSPQHLRELVPDIAEREVYICGPPAMTEVIEQNVRAANVPRKFVHVERFAL